MTSPLGRRLAHLELAASAAARPPVSYMRFLLADGTMPPVTDLPPGGCYILGVREAESSEAWLRDFPSPE